MRRIKFAMLALAAGFMFQGAAAQPASALNVPKPAIAEKNGVTQVRYRGHGGHHGLHGGHHGRHLGFHRRWHGPRIYFGPVYGYNSYGNSCGWLRRKANWTGSPYWWHRYQTCRNGW